MSIIGDIGRAEITPRAVYLNRRAFMSGAAALGGAALVSELLERIISPARTVEADSQLSAAKSPLSTTGETLTPIDDVTHYNNFYEFGVSKSDPAKYAGKMKTHPWNIKVDGLVKTKKTIAIDDLIKLRPLEERVYRHRCVEAWSMVIPWIGYPLSNLIEWAEPLPKAKYVQFISRADLGEMPGLSQVHLTWPYTEGLRMDEAMHPLTLLTFGMYGETLPNQDGAPVRVVIPWKYGFKSAKSIVRIHFTAKEPPTTWNLASPEEYGFYSNVNPNVDRTPWSQRTERRIGLPFWKQNQTTLMFNGYGDEVAHLYTGMDLQKYF